MGTTGTEGYAAEAERFAAYADSIAFEDVHKHWLHLLPATSCRILDVGAGTGRDAAAFAARGHAVTAVEPTTALREHGRLRHARFDIEWIDDTLPQLRSLEDRSGTFDVVVLTAVWMHLDHEQRNQAMPVLPALAAPGGLIVLSLRHGPVPAGRVMFDVRAPETVALAKRQGLSVELEKPDQPSAYSRKDVTWTWLALRKA